MTDFIIIFGAKYLYLIAVGIFLIYLIRLPKEQRIGMLTLSLFGLPITYIVSLIAGYFYNNPRPFVSDHIAPLFTHVANNGFPSDHTLFVAALASIAYHYNKTFGIVLFTIAILVGTARVLAGIHHWVDILGALVIAVAITAVVYKLSRRHLYI